MELDLIILVITPFQINRLPMRSIAKLLNFDHNDMQNYYSKQYSKTSQFHIKCTGTFKIWHITKE